MQHSFEIDLAVRYGILEAVILNNLYFWIEKNRANGTNFFDGFYWTYNSVKAFSELFPYASTKQIRNALTHLQDEGLIQTGNYNKQTYDRTLWYAFTTKGESIFQKGQIHFPQRANGNDPEGEPIPDNKPVITADKKNKRFIPPTVEEVRSYCEERKNKVDPERFVNYYAAIGWKIGKNTMKDWRAAVRTWERNQRQGENGVKLADQKDRSLDEIF